MRRISSRCRRTSARDEGFTLLELVFATSILLVVLVSIMGVFQVVQRQSAYVKDRTESLESMRNAMDRMIKEIRQARVVTPDTVAPTERFEMTSFVLGVETDIVYAVDAQDRLTRSVSGGTPVILQDHLASPSLFTYTSDTMGTVQVVSVTMQVHPRLSPDTVLVLTSEVRLRNRVPVT